MAMSVCYFCFPNLQRKQKTHATTQAHTEKSTKGIVCLHDTAGLGGLSVKGKERETVGRAET